MCRKLLCGRVLCALGVLALAGLLALEPAEPAQSQQAKKKKSPAGGIGPYLTILNNWFRNSDQNSDGFLDKDELAKAFRGPTAKAFDAKDDDKDAEDGASSSAKGKVRPTSLALVCLPHPGLAPNLTVAELLSQPGEKKSKPAKKG